MWICVLDSSIKSYIKGVHKRLPGVDWIILQPESHKNTLGSTVSDWCHTSTVFTTTILIYYYSQHGKFDFT